MNRNKIDDEGMGTLIDGMRDNKSLEILDLSNNEIATQGGKILGDLVSLDN